jgi:hypothetical protein
MAECCRRPPYLALALMLLGTISGTVYALLRLVSAALWDYFEPCSDWEPPAGAKRLVP